MSLITHFWGEIYYSKNLYSSYKEIIKRLLAVPTYVERGKGHIL